MFAVKRALKLNNQEATLMAKHKGWRRVVFNMGLSLRVQMYGAGEFSDSKVINEIKKVLTNYVKKQPECAQDESVVFSCLPKRFD
jgi:putative transposase